MNIQEALAYGRNRLHTSPSPDLDARLLLQYVLQADHSFLVAHGEEALTAEQERQYRRLVDRAHQKVPIPYLTGHVSFLGLDIKVSPAVLIPRPETEQLVEEAIAWAKPRQPLQVVDVGTGSGCVAIALAMHLPQATVEATDVSAEALAIARHNAQRHALEGIRFHQGHLLAPISQPPDLVVANLPYVGDHEWTMLDDGVKLYEPAVALRGGPDGLDLIGQLLHQATSKLKPGGAIFLEIGWQQGPTAQRLAQSYFPRAHVDVILDYVGHDRIVVIKTG